MRLMLKVSFGPVNIVFTVLYFFHILTRETTGVTDINNNCTPFRFVNGAIVNVVSSCAFPALIS